MNISDISNQIHLLQTLEARLKQTQDELSGLIVQYANTLGEISGGGLATELWRDIQENYYPATLADTNKLIDRIQVRDLVVVRDYIDRLRNVLGA